MQQDHHVGVLLERARFTQVGDRRHLVGTLLRPTVELGERDDGDLDLLGEEFECAGELRDLLLAGLDLLSRGHQLQVVDDDELEAHLLFEAAALRPNLDERHVRAVVDVERGVVDAAPRRGDRGPVAGVDGSLAHVLQGDGGLGGEQAHRDLAAAHLEREEDRRHVVLDRRRAGEVEREGRLSERGPCGDDDQLARVEAVREVVQLGESSGDSRHRAVAALGCLDLVDRRLDGHGEGHEVLGDDPAGHPVDLRLGVVDEVDDLALAGVAHLHDPRARLDEAAQHGLLGHDGRVVARVRGGRHEAGERVQVVGAARPGELARLEQLVGDGDHVGRFPVRVQRQDRVEDDLVLGHVEVGGANRLDDVGDGVLAQEHSADGALLGEEVVGRGALRLTLLLRPGVSTLPRGGEPQMCDRHDAPPSNSTCIGCLRHRRETPGGRPESPPLSRHRATLGPAGPRPDTSEITPVDNPVHF